MTIEELSNSIGISSTTILMLEKHNNKASLRTLKLLSSVLEVPISYLGMFEKMPDSTFGDKVRKARYYHGLTKEELAAQIKVDKKTIQN